MSHNDKVVKLFQEMKPFFVQHLPGFVDSTVELRSFESVDVLMEENDDFVLHRFKRIKIFDYFKLTKDKHRTKIVDEIDWYMIECYFTDDVHYVMGWVYNADQLIEDILKLEYFKTGEKCINK